MAPPVVASETKVYPKDRAAQVESMGMVGKQDQIQSAGANGPTSTVVTFFGFSAWRELLIATESCRSGGL